MKNIIMTDEEIAFVFAKDISYKWEQAIDNLLEKYIGDISTSNEDLKFVEKQEFNSEVTMNPKRYAKWCILLATTFINSCYKNNDLSVIYDIEKQNNLTEFNFHYFKKYKKDDSDDISILINKNGLVVDINNNFVTIARERNNKEFTGKWCVNLSDIFIKNLPVKTKPKIKRFY